MSSFDLMLAGEPEGRAQDSPKVDTETRKEGKGGGTGNELFTTWGGWRPRACVRHQHDAVIYGLLTLTLCTLIMLDKRLRPHPEKDRRIFFCIRYLYSIYTRDSKKMGYQRSH